MHDKAEKRFLKAVRSSGLVAAADLDRALEVQALGRRHGRRLAIDRVLLKLELLSREQILGLWRALRYYLWRKEDKLYVKVAVQSSILPEEAAAGCLKEQKRAYKRAGELVRVNAIARQRGYLTAKEDAALVHALRRKNPTLTLAPVDDAAAAEPYEPRSPGAATEQAGDEWRAEARRRDLDELKAQLSAASSAELRGVSDEDLDALWDEADLSDVELDSQAVEIARSPLLDESDEDDDLLLM